MDALTVTVSPNLTFGSFVTNTANKDAFDATLSMSLEAGSTQSLYIYGDSWSGKTHLLQAFVNASENNTVYRTARHLVGEVVEAIRHHKLDEWVTSIMKHSALVIDNLDFLEGKTATQQTLVDVFDAFRSRGGLILSAGLQSPEQIVLDPRIVSRMAETSIKIER